MFTPDLAIRLDGTGLENGDDHKSLNLVMISKLRTSLSIGEQTNQQNHREGNVHRGKHPFHIGGNGAVERKRFHNCCEVGRAQENVLQTILIPIQKTG